MSGERAEALHRQLLAQVSELRTSKEWLDALVVAARFHDYSFGNWLLLWGQAAQRGESVTRPAGYRTWQSLGRQVRKGEKGYQILAPVTRKVEDELDEGAASRVVVGFRVVTVFDVSQTEGEALPDCGPRLLEGDTGAAVLNNAIGLIEQAGFSYRLGELQGPNGTTFPKSKEVVVEGRRSGAQITKTTVHELAHVLMHSDMDVIDCRGRIEVEAESVAYVVCGAAGLDTTSYSVGYVAEWAEATSDPERVLLATAEAVLRVSRRIIESLPTDSEPIPQEPMNSDAFPIVLSPTNDMVRPNRSERIEVA